MQSSEMTRILQSCKLKGAFKLTMKINTTQSRDLARLNPFVTETEETEEADELSGAATF